MNVSSKKAQGTLAALLSRMTILQKTAVACVIAVAAFSIYDLIRPDPVKDSIERVQLLNGSQIATIDKIRISQGTDVIELQKQSGEWLIASQDSAIQDRFPADVHRVIDFLDRLAQLKAEMRHPDAGSALGFEKGKTIAVYAQGKELLSMRTGGGSKEGASAGLWVDVASRGTMWLTQAYSPSHTVPDWELKTIVKIPATRIKTVQFEPPPHRKGGRGFTIGREKDSDPFVVVAPKVPAADVASAELPVLSQALDGVVYDRRLVRSGFDSKLVRPSGSATFMLLDGSSLKVQVASTGTGGKSGAAPEKYYLDFEVKSDSATGPELNGISKWKQTWVFEVSAGQAMKFVKGMEDIQNKKKRGGS